MKKKDEIIMWDDVNFWLSKPDSIEKIKKDALKLFKKYNDLKHEVQIKGIYSVYYHRHIDMIFHFGVLQLIKRIERLEK